MWFEQIATSTEVPGRPDGNYLNNMHDISYI